MLRNLRATLAENTTYWGAGVAVVAVAAVSTTLLVGRPVTWPGAQAPPVVVSPTSAPSPGAELASTRGLAPPANGPTAASEPSPSAPSVQRPAFEIVRVEATGEAVIAGHAAPKASIELRANGRVVAQASADASGDFTMLPPPFSAGEHRLELAARTGEAVAVLSDAVEITVQAPAVQASGAAATPRADALTTPGAPAASTPGSAPSKPDAATTRARAAGSVHPANAARVLLRTYRASDTGRREGLPAAERSPEPEPAPYSEPTPMRAGGHGH